MADTGSSVAPAAPAPLRSKRRYTDDEKREIFEHVCSLVATQARSLKAICDDPGSEIPVCASTIFRWLEADEARGREEQQGFRDWYACAREMQAELLVDEILEIADDARGDYRRQVSPDGTVQWVLDEENICRARLAIDERKWFAAKLHPTKYGSRVRFDEYASGALDLEARLDEGRRRLEALRASDGSRASPQNRPHGLR